MEQVNKEVCFFSFFVEYKIFHMPAYVPIPHTVHTGMSSGGLTSDALVGGTPIACGPLVDGKTWDLLHFFKFS